MKFYPLNRIKYCLFYIIFFIEHFLYYNLLTQIIICGLGNFDWMNFLFLSENNLKFLLIHKKIWMIHLHLKDIFVSH